MKYFILLFILLAPLVKAGPVVATVDAQFSYGFDVTWEHPKFAKHLPPGTALSVEWNGGRYRTTLTSFKTGWSGKVGIIYVTSVPGVPIPSGAVVRVR